MAERVLFVLVMAVVLIVAYRLFTSAQLRKVRQTASVDPLLQTARPGVPTILYFTTPTCSVCVTHQWPALMQVVADLGEQLQVIRVDATEDPAAAERWGVFSVPMTFILGPDGQPQQVNHGCVDAPKLKRQLQALSA